MQLSTEPGSPAVAATGWISKWPATGRSLSSLTGSVCASIYHSWRSHMFPVGSGCGANWNDRIELAQDGYYFGDALLECRTTTGMCLRLW